MKLNPLKNKMKKTFILTEEQFNQFQELYNEIDTEYEDEDEDCVSDLPQFLDSLKPDFLAAAQKVYDDWDQDDEGYDEMYGSGGICHEIESEMQWVFNRKNTNDNWKVGGFRDDYACHNYMLAYDTKCKEIWEVDIPYHHYETGGGYTWKKIKDVNFDESYIEIRRFGGNYDDWVNSEGDFIGEGKKMINEEIAENDFEVIINSEEFKKWFNGSETIDKKGRPIIFYHGTNKEFEKFDTSKIGTSTDAGWLGWGFYFYTDYHEASQYGTVGSYFLKIENIYYATDEDNERLANLNNAKASKKFTKKLIDEGYDGVYYNGNLRGETVVFNPNQIWKIK